MDTDWFYAVLWNAKPEVKSTYQACFYVLAR